MKEKKKICPDMKRWSLAEKKSVATLDSHRNSFNVFKRNEPPRRKEFVSLLVRVAFTIKARWTTQSINSSSLDSQWAG